MKKFKRTLAFLLTLTMLLTAIPLSVWAESSASVADFAGGNGTEESPYLIATKEQLDNVRKNLDAHYKMTADIKFTEADFAEGGAFYNNGDGWKPIGEGNYWAGQNTAFNGTFDGDNHVIDGLRITLKTGAPHNAATERLYVGLFGGISGINGMVKNVILNNNDISVTVEEGSTPKRVSVGGISAQGKISNCVNNGNISISGNIFNPDQEFFVGGIAGGGGELTNCRNTGNVSVNVSVFGYGMSTNDICGVFVGGISGSYGKRMGCENTGAVSAIVNGNPNLQGIKTEAGGITASDGHGRNGGTKVSNCSNSGTVYASISNVNVEHFGGGHIVAGGIATIDVKEIRECVNSGTVSTVADGTSFTYSHTGGIAGSAEKIIKCSNSGDVTAINVYRGRIGGIAGSGYATKITDCYNTGKVHVSAPLFEVNEGGIVGKLEKSSVSSCYNIGEVSTSNIGDSKYIYSGGIAGYIYDYSNTTINNCYYLNTSEKGVGYGTDTATKCTDEQMKQKETYSGFDFGTVWKMDNSYPYFKPLYDYKEIDFQYESGGNDYTDKCYYTDGYFSKSSYEYNPSLATMSLSFAMSAFSSSKGGQSDYSEKSVNARNLLEAIGIPEDNIQINNWYTEKPTMDSIGVIAGNKKISLSDGDYTLIAVAVRGGGYESEWASNFTLGKEGQHEGFNTAKNNVLEFLKSYVENQNITGNVKLWITGFSRAAATSNLVSGALDEDFIISKNIKYDKDDIFTYCFETPAGALKPNNGGILTNFETNKVYNNIYNIINPNDLVPCVAPAVMNFTRYGKDYYLPSRESAPKTYEKLKEEMLSIYAGILHTEMYIVDDFKMVKLGYNPRPEYDSIEIKSDFKNNYSQGVFLSNFVQALVNDFIVNRENYASKYQDEFREIMALVNGGSEEQKTLFLESLSEEMLKKLPLILISYKIGNAKIAISIMVDCIINAVKDSRPDCNWNTLEKAVKDITPTLLNFVVRHPNYTATLLSNMKNIATAHYPELCFSWLASMDKNYNPNATVHFNDGGYRIVQINCPVDIAVYDKETGKLVASIKNEAPVELSDSSYIYGIDEDGQKYVVLPVDSDYTVSITARENATVNYSIQEYCASAGTYTSNLNYFDIELKDGEQLTGIIPAYGSDEIDGNTENGSTAKYILLDPEQKEIKSDSDMRGQEVMENTFTVNAVSSNPEYGVVLGSATHKYGSFAQVEAVPVDGCKFDGWYINDEVVSTESIYRVRVTEDVEITAEFSKDGENLPIDPKPNPTLTLTLNGQPIDGDVAYVKLPSVGMLYKNHSATLGFKIDPSVEVQSVKWSYAGWSVSKPEANIESPDSAETVIRPNGKGIGARSTWVKLTVTDTDGNVYEKTVKVRFYKWDWQRK